MFNSMYKFKCPVAEFIGFILNVHQSRQRTFSHEWSCIFHKPSLPYGLSGEI